LNTLLLVAVAQVAVVMLVQAVEQVVYFKDPLLWPRKHIRLLSVRAAQGPVINPLIQVGKIRLRLALPPLVEVKGERGLLTQEALEAQGVDLQDPYQAVLVRQVRETVVVTAVLLLTHLLLAVAVAQEPQAVMQRPQFVVTAG